MNQIYKYCRSLCDAAFDIAESMDLNVSIVATDLGGHPIVTLRGDRTTFASLEAARRKAVAASRDRPVRNTRTGGGALCPAC